MRKTLSNPDNNKPRSLVEGQKANQRIERRPLGVIVGHLFPSLRSLLTNGWNAEEFICEFAGGLSLRRSRLNERGIGADATSRVSFGIEAELIGTWVATAPWECPPFNPATIELLAAD